MCVHTYIYLYNTQLLSHVRGDQWSVVDRAKSIKTGRLKIACYSCELMIHHCLSKYLLYIIKRFHWDFRLLHLSITMGSFKLLHHTMFNYRTFILFNIL